MQHADVAHIIMLHVRYDEAVKMHEIISMPYNTASLESSERDDVSSDETCFRSVTTATGNVFELVVYYLDTMQECDTPSVTSRALTCSSPAFLTACSGDNIATKLSYNASFRDRLLSPPPAILEILNVYFGAKFQRNLVK